MMRVPHALPRQTIINDEGIAAGALAPPVQIDYAWLGTVPYGEALSAMRRLTTLRDSTTPDTVWCLEHPPVFTLGRAGRRDHLLETGTIDVIASDRGGDVTYHGPGQLVIYTLLDLKRSGLAVRRLITMLEQAVITTVRPFGIEATRDALGPGVYVSGAKLASLGLRMQRSCTLHGIALNVSNDLSPFERINPCGHQGLRMTSIAKLGHATTPQKLAPILAKTLIEMLRKAAGHAPSVNGEPIQRFERPEPSRRVS